MMAYGKRQELTLDILVIVPLYIPIPLPLVLRHDPGRRVNWAVKWFKLGLETAPVIGVLLLLASTCIPGKVVRDGIVGSGGVKPYDIMTLFLCFVSIQPRCCPLGVHIDCSGLDTDFRRTSRSHSILPVYCAISLSRSGTSTLLPGPGFTRRSTLSSLSQACLWVTTP